MTMKKIKILIADDHKLMRMGLESLIAGKNDMECIGEAIDGEDAVQKARKLKPDVILMDLMMPKISGSAATKIILEELPETRIIILTSYGTSKEMSDAIASGACGALTKDIDTSELANTIRTVSAGGTCISEKLRMMSHEESLIPELTKHQKMILSSIAIGRTNADIAKEFSISENTVKHTITAIFAKLGATTRAEAAAIAHRKHLVDA